MLTPQDCIATNSRSAASLPNAISRPRRTAIGMLIAIACGNSSTSTRATTHTSTPFAISGYASRSTGGMIRRNVRSSSDSRNGSTVSRTTYRSKIRIGPTRLQRMTRVALLWHMHQPYYEDLLTREHFLPWVRLHALKDYYGMAAVLREFPDVRVTFNLVPSLLVQLEAFAENRARDRFLQLSLKPAADLTDADAAFIVQNFFHAQRQRMIDAYPRY